MTKKEILNARTIAYYSGFGGLEIKSIEYGIEDYIIYVSGAWCSEKSVHKCKVYYTMSGNAYFKCNGVRVPLSECMRT